MISSKVLISTALGVAVGMAIFTFADNNTPLGEIIGNG